MTSQHKHKTHRHFNYEILTQHNILKNSYLFEDNIDRVYYFFKSVPHLKEMSKDIISDIICVKGTPDYYSVGSVYKFIWKNSWSVELIVEDMVNTPEYKTIQIYYYDIRPSDYRYRVTMKFYRTTVDGFTYFTYDLKFTSPQSLSFYQVNFNTNESRKLLTGYDGYISTNPECLEQVESIVLNTSMKKIWDIITDWKVFQKHVPIIASRIEYERNCEGEIVLIKLNYNNDKTEYYLKVIKSCLKKYAGEFSLLLFSSSKSFPSQELHFNIIEINDSKCLLIFKHVFINYVNCKIIAELSINKKDILKTLKSSLKPRSSN
jgi:hypothetical protein